MSNWRYYVFMNKILKIFIGITVVAVAFWGYKSYLNKKSAVPVNIKTDTIKIGAILPLTGRVAVFGDWIKKGIDLALEDINDPRMKVVYEDSQADAKQSVSIFNKLAETDKADIFISAMSSASVPLIPLVKSKDKILLMQDVTYPNITKESNLLFRHFIQSDREATLLANYAIDKLLAKSAAILYINDEAGVGAKDAFIKVFKEKNGQIYVVESFASSDADMKTQITKIKASNTDVLFLFGNGPSWAKTLTQIKDLKFKGKILTNTAMFIKNFRDAAGAAVEGVYFTYPYADKENKSVSDFVNKYVKRYGTEPEIESYYAWDLINVLYTALKNNNWRVAGLNQSILAIEKFDGAFGATGINTSGDFATPVAVAVIEKGNIKTLEVTN